VPLALVAVPAFLLADLLRTERDLGRLIAVLLTLGAVGLLHLGLAVVGLRAVVRAKGKPREPFSSVLPSWWKSAFGWSVVAGMIPVILGMILLFLSRPHAGM
jgi:hypothetical protein